jgi:ribose transport system substrate-binding protein
MAGDLMAKELGGTGYVAIIDYPTVQSVVDRVNGFRKAIAAYPGIKIVADQPGITRADALAAAQNMLQAHTEITGIFGFGDDAALAATTAVKSAGLSSKVKVIGFDGMAEARAEVDSGGPFVGVIRQFPGKMGVAAIDSAVSISEGKSIQPLQLIEPGVYLKGGSQS